MEGRIRKGTEQCYLPQIDEGVFQDAGSKR